MFQYFNHNICPALQTYALWYVKGYKNIMALLS